MNGRSIATCALLATLAALAACSKKDEATPGMSPTREASVPVAAPAAADPATASPPAPDMPPPERQSRAPKDPGAAAGTAGVK